MGDETEEDFFDGLSLLATRSPFKIFLIASAELSVDKTVERLDIWKYVQIIKSTKKQVNEGFI
jgi:hypothetical protein